jgi:IclR family pca regulon transcriptional regulator
VTDPSSDRAPDAAGDTVQAFARGLAVIRAFDAQHPSLTLSDVARRAGITRAAAGRFLRTLEALGYVRGDGRDFALTPRVLELGFSYLSALSLPEIVQPHLERLSREVEESASAAVLDGDAIVYVARVPIRRIMSVGITIGTRFPALATSMGRVLLAEKSTDQVEGVLTSTPLPSLTPRTRTDPGELRDELARVRTQGWALVDGELEEGLRSIAAPVRGRDGAVVAAVNISMSAGARTTADVLSGILPRLLATTARIDADLRMV